MHPDGPAGSSLLGAGGRAELPYVRGGSGVFLEDEDGRRYLDGSSGALAAALGHGRADMARVLWDQATAVAFAHRTQLRNRATEELADLIAQWAPGGLGRSMFVSSGSDANELALGLSIRYWARKGRPERMRVLARDRSYHGATLGALSLTGLDERRGAMRSLLLQVPRLPSPGPDCDAEGERRLLAELDAAVTAAGPETLAAVMIEAVSGTSGGAIVPPRSFTDRIQQVCRDTGALLIVDEVMSGFGRTGRLFAFEHLGLEPDLVTFGKGVRGG
jgi:adenosylmethionine-8-amino-7-oxononanoate aminotransferase